MEEAVGELELELANDTDMEKRNPQTHEKHFNSAGALEPAGPIVPSAQTALRRKTEDNESTRRFREEMFGAPVDAAGGWDACYREAFEKYPTEVGQKPGEPGSKRNYKGRRRGEGHVYMVHSVLCGGRVTCRQNRIDARHLVEVSPM